jgi:hypothetical protein
MRSTPEARTSGTGTSTRRGRRQLRNLVRHASGAVDLSLATAGTLFAHLPGIARATRVRANATTSALQLLPDSTLQGLAASSIGLGAGFYLAGLPRLVTAAAVTPAMIIGAAIVLRPTQSSSGSGTIA